MPNASPDRYAVIGNPIAHSKSPQIHAAFAEATGQRMSYGRLLAPLDGFAATVEQFMADAGGSGLNVTTPFKLDAFVLARERSERALEAEACNTLAWRADHWFGDNTDGAGLVSDVVRNLDEPIAGRDLLVIGAGGATRGILGPLLAQRPRKLVVANRTETKAADLATRFASRGNISALRLADLSGLRFDIVINATTFGQGADVSPAQWPSGLCAANALAYDLIYADQPTHFLRWATEQGAQRAVDGLGMLIEQAAESFVVWRGVRPDTAPLFSLLRPRA